MTTHPRWLIDVSKTLDPGRKALLSTGLRAALAKATVESTDDPTSQVIIRELAFVGLTELTPTALADACPHSDKSELVAHIKRWEDTKRTTQANTYLVQAIRTLARRSSNDETVCRALWAVARLCCHGYPVNYSNPRQRSTRPRKSKMPIMVSDFLTVCQAAQRNDRVCVERSVNTVIEVINEQF